MKNDAVYSYQMQEIAHINEKIKELLSVLPDFCSEYLYVKTATNKYQPRTRLSYLQEFQTFFKWLNTSHESFMDMPIRNFTLEQMKLITPNDILAFLSAMDYYVTDEGVRTNSASAKARKLAAIRSLFAFFVSNKGFPYNVAARVDTPKVRDKDIVYMSTEQQRVFLKTVDNGKFITNSGNLREYDEQNPYHVRDVAIVSLFLGTGIRISELVGIDVSDIDFRDSSLYVRRKGGNEQKIFFSSDVEDTLLSYLDYSREQLLKGNNEEPALFLSQRAKRISVRTVQELVSKYVDYTFGPDNKKGFSAHKLRSTYASNLLEESDNIYLVAKALGHSDLSTVQKYAKIKDMERAAISLRSDNS